MDLRIEKKLISRRPVAATRPRPGPTEGWSSHGRRRVQQAKLAQKRRVARRLGTTSATLCLKTNENHASHAARPPSPTRATANASKTRTPHLELVTKSCKDALFGTDRASGVR